MPSIFTKLSIFKNNILYEVKNAKLLTKSNPNDSNNFKESFYFIIELYL